MEQIQNSLNRELRLMEENETKRHKIKGGIDLANMRQYTKG